jgi:SAM-dependent methyltransferase
MRKPDEADAQRWHFDANAATYYDFLNTRQLAQGDINFMLRYALRASSILDAGAGTGRIGIGLAEHQLDVTCLEPSRNMVDALLVKVAQRPELFPYITVVCGDPADVDLGRKFDLVSLYWSLIYIMTDEQRVKTLVNLRKHLAPGGRFLVDGSVGLMAFKPGDGRFEQCRVKVGRREYAQYFECQHAGGEIYKLTVTFDVLEGDRVVESSNVKTECRVVPSSQYLRDLLHEAGLEVEEEWGLVGPSQYVPLAEAGQPEKYVLAVARART